MQRWRFCLVLWFSFWARQGWPMTVSAAEPRPTTTLSNYLRNVDPNRFHVHGWRWHTLSLARESARLQRLASTTTAFEQLQVAVDYCIGFNMKGLHRVERELFFPWVIQKIQSSVTEPEIAEALVACMKELERDRQMTEQLGASILKQAAIAGNPNAKNTSRQQAARGIAVNAGLVADTVNHMYELEKSVLVPAVAMLVPEAEQKSFNNQVIRKLGILDSRLHLVGMYEAVQELDRFEKDLFKATIPSIARTMLPRWKRNLYDPRRPPV